MADGGGLRPRGRALEAEHYASLIVAAAATTGCGGALTARDSGACGGRGTLIVAPVSALAVGFVGYAAVGGVVAVHGAGWMIVWPWREIG